MSSFPAVVPAGWESEVKSNQGNMSDGPSNPLLPRSRIRLVSALFSSLQRNRRRGRWITLLWLSRLKFRCWGFWTISQYPPRSNLPVVLYVFLERTQTQDGKHKSTHNRPIPGAHSWATQPLYSQNNNAPRHRVLMVESCHVKRDGFKQNICLDT